MAYQAVIDAARRADEKLRASGFYAMIARKQREIWREAFAKNHARRNLNRGTKSRKGRF